MTWFWRIQVRPLLARFIDFSAAASGQFCSDGSRGRVGEQVIYDIAEDAGPAASTTIKFVFGAAAHTVDVEPNARAAAACWLLIDNSRQDAFVSAGADSAGAFGLLVAVAADDAVGPSCDGLVVLTAAVAGDRPAETHP